MKRLLLASVAAVVTTTSMPTAHAAPPGTGDLGCGFIAVTDVSPEAPQDTVTGVLFGGPVRQTGHLTCTVKVGVATHAASYVNGAEADGWGAGGVTYVGPRVVSFAAPRDVPVYLCDRFDQSVYDARSGTWVPAGTPGATCRLVLGTGWALDPLFDLLDSARPLLDSLKRDVVDPLVCPVLASLAGDYVAVSVNSQGDVFVLGEPYWDCPPYDLGPTPQSDPDVAVVVVPPAVATVGST
ncbi:MAG TPA: hypothetical protein VNQ77_16615 [Frankiaceae bacterium]|nr:hypothetical protein [Frankiaceae bacterium]